MAMLLLIDQLGHCESGIEDDNRDRRSLPDRVWRDRPLRRQRAITTNDPVSLRAMADFRVS
jgi:hypothetical protein